MRKFLWVLCIVGLGSFATSARAQIPTTDIAAGLQRTQQILSLAEQVKQAKDAYDRQFQELQAAIAQQRAMEGVTGVGNLLNGGAEQDARKYLPATWEDTMAILAAGGNPGSAPEVERIMRERERAFQISTREEVGLLGPDDPTAVAAEYNRRSTLASQAVAETAYARANGRVETYEDLMRAIENTPTAKVSADLANRIAAENGLTSNEMIRVLSSLVASESAEKAEDQVARSKMEQRFKTGSEGNPQPQ